MEAYLFAEQQGRDENAGLNLQLVVEIKFAIGKSIAWFKRGISLRDRQEMS